MFLDHTETLPQHLNWYANKIDLFEMFLQDVLLVHK